MGLGKSLVLASGLFIGVPRCGATTPPGHEQAMPPSAELDKCAYKNPAMQLECERMNIESSSKMRVPYMAEATCIISAQRKELICSDGEADRIRCAIDERDKLRECMVSLPGGTQLESLTAKYYTACENRSINDSDNMILSFDPYNKRGQYSFVCDPNSFGPTD